MERQIIHSEMILIRTNHCCICKYVIPYPFVSAGGLNVVGGHVQKVPMDWLYNEILSGTKIKCPKCGVNVYKNFNDNICISGSKVSSIIVSRYEVKVDEDADISTILQLLCAKGIKIIARKIENNNIFLTIEGPEPMGKILGLEYLNIINKTCSHCKYINAYSNTCCVNCAKSL